MTPAPTAITVGNFDGVHAGHADLVRRAREAAGERGRVVALAFDPNPLAVLSPDAAPPILTTFNQRAERLRALGADEVERLDPRPTSTRRLLEESAEDFVRSLVNRYRPSAVVEGEDFRFGRGRAGCMDILRALGAELGFQTITVPARHVALRDQTVVRASSSVVRWLLAGGRVRDAAAVLGRRHEVTGEVVRGDRRGRTAGFPTANIRAEQTAPADGVYAGFLVTPDGRRLPAAVNVGTRPTFDGLDRRVEAHAMLDGGVRGDAWRPLEGLDEYGWHARLEFVGWIRDQVRFPSPQALVAQLERDTARALRILGIRPARPDIARRPERTAP